MKHFTKSFLFGLIALLCSVSASAYDFEMDGIYYNILSVDDLTVEVTNGGEDYTGDVVIPSTVTYKSRTLSVTRIGSSAFLDCSSLTSIEIPNSVTSIRDNAFSGCSSLKDLHIEDGTTLLSLGNNNSSEGLFYDCPLVSLHLGRDLDYATDRSYGYSPFASIKSLITVTIGDSVTRIRGNTFRSCSSLTSIEIPNSVTSIGYNAFSGCSSLTRIEIPNSVTSIGEEAFSFCSSLTRIEIPNSVTSIGNNAFYSCSSLKDLHIEDGTTVLSLGYNSSGLNGGLFSNRPLVSLHLGRNLSYSASYSCGYSPFASIKSLITVTIGDSVTSIGKYAFYNCSNLTSIEIGNSVTSIGREAFYNCSSLTSIVIPNSVTSISYEAFNGCSSLSSIYMLGTTPPSVGSDNFTNRQYLDATLYVPNGSLAAYQSADTWKNFWEIKEYDAIFKVDSIYYQISSFANLTVEVTSGDNKYTGDVVIPSTVLHDSKTFTITSVGDSAFYDCSSLTSIEIPNSVTSIGNNAFYECSSLTSIEIPNSVTSIGERAFWDCSSLTSIEIPNSVTSIEYCAFCYCSNLTSIEIGNSVTSIGEYAFYGCSSLTSIEIPNSVTSIGNNAFSGCSSLTSIEIPNSVTSIGNWVFRHCSSLTSIEIPNNVTSIGEYAFYECSNLTSIEIGNSVTSIGEYAFSDCSNLTSIEIGNSVTSIGNYAFRYCSSLTNIYMQGATPPSVVGWYNFTNKHYLDATLYVPNGSLAAYQSADTWKEFQNIKEYSPTGIDDISADNMEIKFTGNGISVPNAVDKAVYVYSVNGAVVEKLSHYDGGEILLGKGTYIIRIGEKAIKVQL